MILSDVEIQEAVANGVIVIDPPPPEERYTTSAVDLLLGDEFVVPKAPEELEKEEPPGVETHRVLDLLKIDLAGWLRKYGVRKSEPDGTFVLDPGRLVLGKTKEYIELPTHIAARVEGRSTLARLGLLVHLTAPTIHAGFKGCVVLEMYNVGPYPLRLTPGLQICRIIFEKLSASAEGPVRTQFQGQKQIRK